MQDNYTSPSEINIAIADVAQRMSGSGRHSPDTRLALREIQNGVHSGEIPTTSICSDATRSTVSPETAGRLVDEFKHLRPLLAKMSDPHSIAEAITEGERLRGKLDEAQQRGIAAAEWADEHLMILSAAFDQIASELVAIDPELKNKGEKTPAIFIGKVQAGLALNPDPALQAILAKYNLSGVLNGLVASYLDRPLQLAAEQREAEASAPSPERAPTKGGRPRK